MKEVNLTSKYLEKLNIYENMENLNIKIPMSKC